MNITNFFNLLEIGPYDREWPFYVVIQAAVYLLVPLTKYRSSGFLIGGFVSHKVLVGRVEEYITT